jgi:hypothetical protein
MKTGEEEETDFTEIDNFDIRKSDEDEWTLMISSKDKLSLFKIVSEPFTVEIVRKNF